MSPSYDSGFIFAFAARKNKNFHLVVSYDAENIPVMMMAVLYCNVSLTPQDIEQAGVTESDRNKLYVLSDNDKLHDMVDKNKLSNKIDMQYHIGIHRTFYNIENYLEHSDIKKGDALTFFKGSILCIRKMYKMNPTYLYVNPIGRMEDKLRRLIESSKLKNYYDNPDLSLIIDKYKEQECILQQNGTNIMDLSVAQSVSQFTNTTTCIININPGLDSVILEKLKKINCGWCKGMNTAGTGFLLKTNEFLIET